MFQPSFRTAFRNEIARAPVSKTVNEHQNVTLQCQTASLTTNQPNMVLIW